MHLLHENVIIYRAENGSNIKIMFETVDEDKWLKLTETGEKFCVLCSKSLEAICY